MINNFIALWQEKFIDDCILSAKDHKSIENYNTVLDHFYIFITSHPIYDLKDINTNTIRLYFIYRDEQWIKNPKNKKKEPLSFNTKQNDKKVLKLFFEYIEYTTDENPNQEMISFASIRWKRITFKNTTKPKTKYNSDDVVKYLHFLEKLIRNKRDDISYTLSFIFKLCIYGGLRASEACQVKFEDFGKIRLVDDVKLIDITIRGKGGKVAKIPLKYQLIKKEYSYFKRKLTIYTNKNSLFTTRTHKPMNRFVLYREFEKITQLLDLSEKGIHILRHTWANKLNDIGIDIGDIQQLMRHSSITTTKVYVKRSDKRIDRVVIDS